ncbi:MAG: hypothetical protein PHR18_02870, partial [Oscillospiraceae bacterium]|nr:hypothetical protein [Oscillospiraceae bacterium]
TFFLVSKAREMQGGTKKTWKAPSTFNRNLHSLGRHRRLGELYIILLSSKNQVIFGVCFPPYSVVVVGGLLSVISKGLVLMSD